MKKICSVLAVMATMSGLAGQAAADTYPDRAIRLIVPFPAGGPTDILARLLAKNISDSTGQAVVVDNRGGAGGTVGVDAVARSAPDGYTLLLGSTTTIAVSPHTYKVSYDIQRDFAPVALFASSPLTLVTNGKSGIHTVRELVAHAASHPGKTFYGSPGAGTQSQLAAEMFMAQAGMHAIHVPYKGGAPALIGLQSGEVDFMFDIIQTSIPLSKSGRINVIALTSPQRNPNLPDVPTVGEAGLPKFNVVSWLGVLAPAGTPRDIIEKLDGVIKAAVGSPEAVQQLAEMGTLPSYLPHAEFASLMAKEIDVWGKLADANNAAAQ